MLLCNLIWLILEDQRLIFSCFSGKEVIEAITNSPNMTFLDLEGNTLGVEAAEAIGEALKGRQKLTRALWKDMFTGRMKNEIPKALVKLPLYC